MEQLDSGKIFFDSRQNFQKIYLQGSVNITAGAFANASVPIPHNLGYWPAVRTWWTNRSGAISEPFNDAAGFYLSPVTSSFSGVGFWYKVYTDRIVLTFRNNTGSSLTTTASYRIYIDEA